MASLAFDVTVADFEAFNLHQLNAAGRRAKRLRNHAMFLLVMAAALTAYYRAIDVLHTAADLPLLFGPPLGFGLASLLALEALRPWFLRRQIQSLLGRAPRDAFLGHKRLDAGAEGLTITAETSTTQCAWAAITRVDETAQHLFLMLGNASGIIIPKRGQPQAALDALRAYLAARPGKAAAIAVPA